MPSELTNEGVKKDKLSSWTKVIHRVEEISEQDAILDPLFFGCVVFYKSLSYSCLTLIEILWNWWIFVIRLFLSIFCIIFMRRAYITAIMLFLIHTRQRIKKMNHKKVFFAPNVSFCLFLWFLWINFLIVFSSNDAQRIEPSFLVVVLGNVEFRVVDTLLIPGSILVENVEFILEGIEEDHLSVEEQRSIEQLSSAELHVILIRHRDEILEIHSLIDYSLLSENL